MDIVEFVYEHSSEKTKIYNMVNVASVLQHIRNGCILGDFDKDSIKDLYTMLDTHKIYAMKYPIHKPSKYINVIIMRKSDKNLEKLYLNLYDTYEKDINQFSINTGKIIGYIHPSTLKNSNKPSHIAYIEIQLVNLNDNSTHTIHFYSQRVRDTSEKTFETLETTRKEVLNLKLPKGFVIDYASLHLGN